jgi:hypothetical protein
MSKLVIEDLEYSIELDREAMRVIVGLGTRPLWRKDSTAFFLMHQSRNATGLRAAAGRWSEYLRPLPLQTSQPALDVRRWKSQRSPRDTSADRDLMPFSSLDE